LSGIRYDDGGRKTESAVADVAPETNVVALTAQVSSCKQNFINFASELTNKQLLYYECRMMVKKITQDEMRYNRA
jgi:hypothetical protein